MVQQCSAKRANMSDLTGRADQPHAYAELAIYQAPVRRTFLYSIPADLPPLAVGQLVEVSFRTSRSQGIVVELCDSSPVPHPKPILDVLIPEPVVTPAQIVLAQWM